MNIQTTEQISCMGFDAFRILQGMEPHTYTAEQICAALARATAPASAISADDLLLKAQREALGFAPDATAPRTGIDTFKGDI